MDAVGLLNGMIGACTGIFLGHVLYKLRSIVWYEDLFYWGIVWLISIIVLTLIKRALRESPNKE